LEAAGTHLEAGFDQAAQALLAAGVLEERGFLERCDALERAARDASTMNELFAAYRRALSDLVKLAEAPTQASRDQRLARAIDYIHTHFVEPLSVPQVASVAGFAPNYFAQLFKQREKMTFDQYVRRIRVERAQQLLKSTDLSAERVGQLSGFALRPYFFRVFKDAVGMTPHEYRIQSNSP
ncbi:MAG TPA: helix-turn-helix domain-containing protein, partial [Polyangiaceae bacterium]|nr:helix-turn-helix domain-containing protein [Polyangiaceae bacterium]